MNERCSSLRPIVLGRRSVWALVLVGCGSGCGYQSVRAAHATGRLAVRLGACAVDATVAGDVLLATRATLSRDGALGGAGDHVIVIEVSRGEDSSSAIVANEAGPRARATTITLVGRAYIDAAGGFDTGDISVETSVSSFVQPAEQLVQTEGALRDLARRLGQALGERILGAPAGLRNGSRGVTDMLLSRP